MKNIGLIPGIVALLVATTILVAGCGKKGGESPQATKEAVGTEIVQKICPVMGGPIDKSIYVDHEGRRVYFCCQMCVNEFKKDPEKYLKKFDEELHAEPEAPHGHRADEGH